MNQVKAHAPLQYCGRRSPGAADGCGLHPNRSPSRPACSPLRRRRLPSLQESALRKPGSATCHPTPKRGRGSSSCGDHQVQEQSAEPSPGPEADGSQWRFQPKSLPSSAVAAPPSSAHPTGHGEDAQRREGYSGLLLDQRRLDCHPERPNPAQLLRGGRPGPRLLQAGRLLCRNRGCPSVPPGSPGHSAQGAAVAQA